MRQNERCQNRDITPSETTGMPSLLHSVFSLFALITLYLCLSLSLIAPFEGGLLCKSLFKHEHLAQLANTIVSSQLELTHLF